MCAAATLVLALGTGCRSEPVVIAPASPQAGPSSVDALPSWNDGPSKKAIVDFVGRVTREGGPDFVPPSDRIATFDNEIA
jgi:hypothetical protein